MENKPKRTYHIYLDKDIADRFQKLYPNVRSEFLTNAMELAINDRNFFDKVRFYKLLSSSDTFKDLRF